MSEAPAQIYPDWPQQAAVVFQTGPLRIRITPAMLAAGRAAFKRKRRLLDDLWTAYDCDVDAAVRDIYRSMARAAE